MLVKNVYEAILKYGHDEDFHPTADAKFLPTEAPAGSQEKIEVLRRRIELGQPLWHEHDRVDYEGLTGAIQPREDNPWEDNTSGERTSQKNSPGLSDFIKGMKSKDEKSQPTVLDNSNATSSSGGSIAQTQDHVDASNVSPLSSLKSPNIEELEDEDLGAYLKIENRSKTVALLKQAANPIVTDLKLELARELFKLAEKPLEGLSIKEMTRMVDLVSAVAINRALSQENSSRQKAKKTLAAKLNTDESALDKLLEDALASQQSTVFDLLLKRPLGDIEKFVVQRAQRYFENETREWQQNSLESMSATMLKGVGGLIQRILEPEKLVGPIHRQEQQEPTEGTAIQKKAAVIEETASGEFENVTLDKTRSKELAQGLWRKLQDDPKALYQKALALKKDKNMLPEESNEDYFKRLFLVALTGAYRNSDYPPILKPLHAVVSRLDNYFRDSFFFYLNQYLLREEKILNANKSYSDVAQKNAFISGQIYQLIPLELFNIWAPNPNWGPVLKALLTEQQTVNEISETLNLKSGQQNSTRNKISKILWVLKPYFSSRNEAPQLPH